MNGDQFKRRARKWARKSGLPERVEPSRGKGGHTTQFVGNGHTVVKSGEIGPGPYEGHAQAARHPRGGVLMQAWSYPASLTRHGRDEVVVGFRDLPEVLTSGANEAKARMQAADALEEAVLGRLARGETVPAPRPAGSGEIDVPLDPVTAARAALASAMAEGRVTNVALAARMNKTEGAVRRLVNGRTAVKMDSVLAALRALGREVALQVG